MANPSRYSMFIRLVGGNSTTPYPGTLNPDNDESKISAHNFIAALQMWSNGEITKADVVSAYNFTHPDDDLDLDLFRRWLGSSRVADLEPKFTDILEWRIILAREKQTIAGTIDLDGTFGYAIKTRLVGGADNLHSLDDSVSLAIRYATWAGGDGR